MWYRVLTTLLLAATLSAAEPARAGWRTESSGMGVQRAGSGAVHFTLPSGLAVNARGELYVADVNNLGTRIQRLSSSGRRLASWSFKWRRQVQNAPPVGLAVEPGGNLWVTDTNGDRVLEYSPAGRPLQAFGGTGSRVGQFKTPMGIAADAQGDIFVADTVNNRVQKLFLDPTRRALVPLAAWPAHGTGRGLFDFPTGIAVGRTGNVYVVDVSGPIRKLAGTGRVLTVWHRLGGQPGQFNTPTGVALDRHGSVYVADSNNHRVQKLTSHGQPLAVWRAPTKRGQYFLPEAIAVAPDGRVYVTNAAANSVVVFSSAGKVLAVWK